MTVVLNSRELVGGLPERAIYVDRRTLYGNPFQIGPDGNRAEVIEKHKCWLDGDLDVPELRERRRWVLEHVHELCDYDAVVCWCAPESCHSDYLVVLAYQRRGILNVEEAERGH